MKESHIALQQELIRATAPYFEETLNYERLSIATEAYNALMKRICSQELDDEVGRNNIEGENGISLGTYWAALCLGDILRTRQFLRGIQAAIEDKIHPKKPLNILYAGSGPFATLLLPIMLRRLEHPIHYTLLEINPVSFELVQKVIATLQLDTTNIHFVNDDATSYQINTENPPDIIISETMQNALAKEQQVPIYLNLMRQVSHDAVFIPEKIALHVGFKKAGVPIGNLSSSNYHKEVTVFEVSKEALFPTEASSTRKPNEGAFKKKRKIIALDDWHEFDHVALMTEIQVYKNEKIGLGESGLTMPIYLQDVPVDFSGSLQFESQYTISSEPKLEYTLRFSS